MHKNNTQTVKRLSRHPGSAAASRPTRASSLDTLAQVGTRKKPPFALGAGEDDLRLSKSAKFDDKSNFCKRARVKYLTNALSLRLASLDDTPLVKSYWNSYYCSSILQKMGGKLTSKYCKNRWCLVCSRIRTAQLIKQYLPLMREWQEKQFVTLTVPNCSGADLVDTIEQMKAVFNRIREQIKKQYQRCQRDAPLVALRKLECTFNPRRRDFHPHFHLIVCDLATANELRTLWLKFFPSASWDCQDVKPANDASVLELFKYFTKLVTSKEKDGRIISVGPLDTIFQAITGQRTFQAFNVTTTKEATDEEANELADQLEIEAIYEWDQAATDWVDKSTGELLTGYAPDEEFRKLVETKIIHAKTPSTCQ
jgi:Replication protein